MNKEDLIEALRRCAYIGEEPCAQCPAFQMQDCHHNIMTMAADLLKAWDPSIPVEVRNNAHLLSKYLSASATTEAADTAKADSGKLRLSLVPPEIITAIAEVREYGNRKYHGRIGGRWRRCGIGTPSCGMRWPPGRTGSGWTRKAASLTCGISPATPLSSVP